LGIFGMLFDGRTGPSKPSAPSGANRVFRKNLGQGFGEFLIKNGNIGGACHVRNSRARGKPYHMRNPPLSALGHAPPQGRNLKAFNVECCVMNLKSIATVLVLTAASVCAQAQQSTPAKPTKEDAQKVFKAISSDKAKLQTFCDIAKLGDEMEKANEKRDSKK